MTKDAKIYLRLTAELKAWVEAQAKAEGRSTSDWVYRRLWELRALHKPTNS